MGKKKKKRQIKPLLIRTRNLDQPIIEEQITGETWMRWAYQTSKASWIERLLFHSPICSKLMGWWCNSPFSRHYIPKMVQKWGLNPDEFEKNIQDYRSFNDFFTRRLRETARPFDPTDTTIVSPGDGRITIYPRCSEGTRFKVKDEEIDVHLLLGEKVESFSLSSLIVLRLAPSDYHRFHFPLNGEVIRYWKVQGHYHSVHPIALEKKHNVFFTNKRDITLLQNPLIGLWIMVEVGAFGVGSIIQKESWQPYRIVKKMEEKGFFQFGGSTVILLFSSPKISFSEDLIQNSQEGFETYVRTGETIGYIKEDYP